MNMLEIDKAIKTIIKSLSGIDISYKVYANHAPDKATYPYIVFRLEDTIDTSPSYNHNLKFMIYDHRNTSARGNMAVADIIQNAFNKQQYLINGTGIHSVLTIRQHIPSEFLVDSQVIELQFDLKTYRKD